MDNSKTKNIPDTPQNFPVVGIGASAGGLDAFKKLLGKIPENIGMAYVIVQHLSPDYSSNLSEILSNFTKIPVNEIINDINLAPNNIYIIPENSFVTAEDGVLKLTPRTRNDKVNTAIDIFMSSLAEVHKSFAIGIILSGTAYDGTIGLKRIKELGGATIAQDPESATFKSMPQSAIDSDAADYILKPEDIPLQLMHIRNTYETNYGYVEEEHIPKTEEEILKQIIRQIQTKTGHDFSQYKQPTIRRRIARRMIVTKRQTLTDYFNMLRNDKNEQLLLFNDFLIPVSHFFRDAKAFEALSETILPLLRNPVNKNLRIWVAGCSTGEEAYSIAICIHEFLLSKSINDVKVQIFATDISEKSITKARAAVYAKQDVQNVSAIRLHTYFTRRDGNYHINKVIRDMCVFAVHNFIKDPPFAKIDLISCRNVLIYFNPFLQNKVLSTFHYALRENGLLFIGMSESIGDLSTLFELLSKRDKFYLKKFAASRYVPETSNMVQQIQVKVKEDKMDIPDTDFRKIASDIIFSKYTPAAVVINQHHEILHFHGDTSAFLQPSQGKPNFNVLKMAREGIAFELRNALIRAKNDRTKITKENITVQDQPYLANIEIVPLHNPDRFMMIVFTKVQVVADDGEEAEEKKSVDQLRIKDLEAELAQLREDIKRVTEEQQTAFEELQTTNEELLSSSEELQALNEELQTSTEEMQSNNEELMCVNDELMDRQEQLVSLRNYSEAIINTIREPLIVLDKNFRIRSVNPSFYNYFKTTEQEVENRSLFDLGKGHWDLPEFRPMLEKVLSEKQNIKEYKIKGHFSGLGERVLLINAIQILNMPSELILMAIEDITEISKAQDLLETKNKELELYNDQLQSFSWAASHDLQEPLRKIHMFSKMILEEDNTLSEKSQHYLERITVSIENMRRLIEDLMSYTKTITIEHDRKKTDLNVLLKKTITDLKDLIKE
ncbi:MAG TPA: CheR family methyltransferase, partial [Flavobacterium sp.]